MKNEKQKALELYNSMKNNASEKDVEEIDRKIHGMNRGKLEKLWKEIMAMYNLIKDPSAAWKEKVIAIAALIYVISPLDAIPDILPFVGLTDDAAVIVAAIAALGTALNNYNKN